MKKISVVGVACLFSGAETVDAFWDILISEKNTLSRLTRDKLGFDPESLYDPTKRTMDTFYNLEGGYIRNFKPDSSGFKIPASEIERYDEMFQWALHVAKKALADSGYLGQETWLKNCGVILGNLSVGTKASCKLTAQIYDTVLAALLRNILPEKADRPGNIAIDSCLEYNNIFTGGYISALVAKGLGLQKAHFSLDAACASSLYALKLAGDYLVSGKADLMLAGAVNCPVPLFSHAAFSAFHALPDAFSGVCKPLDASSSGMLPAEGAAMFVLKRYEDAVRDGDKIYANILGVGLSNDGEGKHVLSPNRKGQVLALRRAYRDAGLNPEQVEYIECHATGTQVGDKTEMDAMETFFMEYNHSPFLGSVKSNLGHTLTVSGMAGILKVIMSLKKKTIPATINLSAPIRSGHGFIGGDKIIRQAVPWNGDGKERIAGVSAFGFGGNNAHLILSDQLQNTAEMSGKESAAVVASRGLKTERMVVVGLAAHWGQASSLQAFEQSLYTNEILLRDLPEERWKGFDLYPELLKQYGFMEGKAPQGSYIDEFSLDFLKLRIPPNEDDYPLPQHLLCVKISDQAISKAKLKKGSHVAVIVAMEMELATHQYYERLLWPQKIKKYIMDSNINLSDKKMEELIFLLKDTIHPPVYLNQFTSFIGNIMTGRISSLWDFTGPSFTISSRENSVFRAMEVASILLEDPEIEAVVVGAVDLAGGIENTLLSQKCRIFEKEDQGSNVRPTGEGAGAIILKRLIDAEKCENEKYAIIESIGFSSPGSNQGLAEVVESACRNAFAETEIKPENIGLLEFCNDFDDEKMEGEIRGIKSVYNDFKSRLKIAVGCIKRNIGDTGVSGGMAALIKTILALHHRYIPGVPCWQGSDLCEHLTESPFYIPAESVPWNWNLNKRYAAINHVGVEGACSHIILAEERSAATPIAYTWGLKPKLFLIGAPDINLLLSRLTDTEENLNRFSPENLATKLYAHLPPPGETEFVVALIAEDREKLIHELRNAEKGIKAAFDKGEDWNTPGGSYFTALPLGPEGKVSFVYPGAFNSYPGMMRELLKTFPVGYKAFSHLSVEDYMAFEEKLYPRSVKPLSVKDLMLWEEEFLHNTDAMFIAGTSSGMVLTKVLCDSFRIQPDAALGYSLGEFSMLSALGAYENVFDVVMRLRDSLIFKSQLSGENLLLADLWGLSAPERKWESMVLMCPVDHVRRMVEAEERVFMTHINTRTEVVIAGDPQRCMDITRALGCSFYKAPFQQILHCRLVKAVSESLVKLIKSPVKRIDSPRFYFSAGNDVSAPETNLVAQNIVASICQTFDFPALIDRAYNEGHRIFIETGPGNTCTRWINENLKHTRHLAVNTNARGVSDYLSILKMIASLASHRVHLNLSELFKTAGSRVSAATGVVKKIKLGGELYKPVNIMDESVSRQKVNFKKGNGATRQFTSEKRDSVNADIENRSVLQRTCKPLTEISKNSVQKKIMDLILTFSMHSNENTNLMHELFLDKQLGTSKKILKAIRMFAGETPGRAEVPFNPGLSEAAEVKSLFSEKDLLEFAYGSIAAVFGEKYRVIDLYRKRLRLPLPPYHFVSRVMNIKGDPGVFAPCSIETEYDIPRNVWYLVGGRMPLSILLEATHGAIFLTSYMGVEFVTKGSRVYRALDGKVTMPGSLPVAGDVLRYMISIDSYIHSGSQMLFYLTCQAFVRDRIVLTFSGSAGLFTEEDLENSKGIRIPQLKENSKSDVVNHLRGFSPGKTYKQFREDEILSLLSPDPGECLKMFRNESPLSRNLYFASKPLLMFDYIVSIHSAESGGQADIVAEKKLSKDGWYFKCHFKDDYCLPGVLLIEGCSQLLRFYILYKGMHKGIEEIHFRPKAKLSMSIKNRGQIIPSDIRITYFIRIKEASMTPVPYVIGDAYIKREDKIIASLENISVEIG